MSAVLAPRVDRDQIAATCYMQLRDELMAALTTDPQTVVQTPGYGPNKYTAAMVVLDDMSGEGQPLRTLLAIVRDGAKGEDVALRCSAWIAERANVHAAYHMGDLANEVLDARSDA